MRSNSRVCPSCGLAVWNGRFHGTPAECVTALTAEAAWLTARIVAQGRSIVVTKRPASPPAASQPVVVLLPEAHPARRRL